MIAIDIPQVGYKTWLLEYRMYDKNGNRCRMEEREAELSLSQVLSKYEYSSEHDHIK